MGVRVQARQALGKGRIKVSKKPHLVVPALAVFLMIIGAAALAQHKEVSPQAMFWAQKQVVTLEDFPAKGLILDIGGGGAGVIGRLKGAQVVAVDLNKQELVDAPGQPLIKIVMDARDLKFLDGSFPTATVFFTFMYIDPADHEKVFEELHRVLAPGGRLLIWDVFYPTVEDKTKTHVVYPVTVKLPGGDINTGYGARLRPTEMGLPHFEELAKKTGFEIVGGKRTQSWFFLELTKPGAAPAKPAVAK
jgi:ubiquinone/menaquinone biosynthesis C-methylase UbiE